MTQERVTQGYLADPVSTDCPGAKEIGFALPDAYNASEILFQNLAAETAEKTAIISDQGSVTYRELCQKASATGHALVDYGLARGARVLLFLDDSAAYPAIFFGAIRAGYVPVLINTLSPPELLRFYLEDSSAEIVFFDVCYDHLFGDEALAGTAVKRLIAVNGNASESGDQHISKFEWDPWIADYPSELDAVDTHRDDMAFWMYSSGSTGRPKGIVHLQHDMQYSVESFGRHVLGVTRDDVCFSVPKIFFAYGLGNSTYFPFSVGASVVLHKGRPTADAVFDAIEKHKPTLLFGLPTLYNSLVQSARKHTADLSSLRLCLSAAETLSADLAGMWKSLFGFDLIEGLGSTELTHVYLSNLPNDFRTGSAGKRVPGYEVKLTDADGKVVPAGEEGIMWVRADSSAPYYWNRPEKTADTMRDDWIYTGDRFVKDEDDFYFFRGRADDLIKVSGQWVYPLEIELCLANHPSVAECAVLAVEQIDRRMTLFAYVVTTAEAEANLALTKQLQDYVKEKLVPYKYPRIVNYLAELPKTGTDKIDRQMLLQHAKAQVQSEAS